LTISPLFTLFYKLLSACSADGDRSHFISSSNPSQLWAWTQVCLQGTCCTQGLGFVAGRHKFSKQYFSLSLSLGCICRNYLFSFSWMHLYKLSTFDLSVLL
jgi:hypothetical protein